MRTALGLVSFIATLVSLPLTGYAQQSCASNADCVKGTACQPSSIPPPRVVAPACVGAPCDASTACVGTACVDAASVVQSTCQPAACQTDSDCGSGMICHADSSTTCVGGTTPACPPNTKCDAGSPAKPTPETCTETTTLSCVYLWQLPCNHDADCGAGFSCAPSATTSCVGSGGGGSGTGIGSVADAGRLSTTTSVGPTSGAIAVPPTSVDAGAPPFIIDAGGSCTTTSTYPGFCQPKATTCSVDTDCPASWTCVAPSVGVSGGGVASGPSAGSTGAPVTTTPPGTQPPVLPVATTKTCQPPYAFPVRGGSASASPGETATGADGGAPTGPAAPGAGTVKTPSASATSSGCTVGGAGAPLASGSALHLALLSGLFGLAALRSRRRQAHALRE